MLWIDIKTKEILDTKQAVSRIKNVSFPVNKEPDISFMAGKGFAVFYDTPAPVVLAGQVAELADPPYENKNGQWRRKWLVRDMNTEELQAYNAAAQAAVESARKARYEENTDHLFLKAHRKALLLNQPVDLTEWLEACEEIKILIPDHVPVTI